MKQQDANVATVVHGSVFLHLVVQEGMMLVMNTIE
jgi:hypothetical protein